MTAPAATVCAVPRCDRPTHNQYVVCTACLAGLRADLRELPELLPELEVTLTRQNASGAEAVPEPPEEARTKDGPPAATTVLMFRPLASDVGRHLHESLDVWARHLLEALDIDPIDALGPRPEHRTTSPGPWTLELAAWLERHPDGIATNPDAGALVENLRYAIEDVRRIVFPRQLAYCGPCEEKCGEQLYAPHGAEHVRCRVCRRRWVIADRLAELSERAHGMLLSAEEMARALPRIAANIAIPPLTAAQIRGFAFRGRLARHPYPRGETRYKVGEVIALMHLLLAEEQDRQARRARQASAATRDRMQMAHERFREALRA